MKPLQAKRLARKGVRYLAHRFSRLRHARKLFQMAHLTSLATEGMGRLKAIRASDMSKIEKSLAIASTVINSNMAVFGTFGDPFVAATGEEIIESIRSVVEKLKSEGLEQSALYQMQPGKLLPLPPMPKFERRFISNELLRQKSRVVIDGV